MLASHALITWLNGRFCPTSSRFAAPAAEIMPLMMSRSVSPSKSAIAGYESRSSIAVWSSESPPAMSGDIVRIVVPSCFTICVLAAVALITSSVVAGSRSRSAAASMWLGATNGSSSWSSCGTAIGQPGRNASASTTAPPSSPGLPSNAVPVLRIA